MGDVSLSTVRGQPRRKIVTLTASNAALAIPSWAQGGKGVVLVSGVGGGSSGAITISSGSRGRGGASGALAQQREIPIPAGVTTLAAVIGAGGAAVSGTTELSGNPGGETSITVGTLALSLGGGTALGNPYRGGVPNIQANVPLDSTEGGVGQGVSIGNRGGSGSSSSSGYGAGASSPFGVGGAGAGGVGT